jgi:hypothetical protein
LVPASQVRLLKPRSWPARQDTRRAGQNGGSLSALRLLRTVSGGAGRHPPRSAAQSLRILGTEGHARTAALAVAAMRRGTQGCTLTWALRAAEGDNTELPRLQTCTPRGFGCSRRRRAWGARKRCDGWRLTSPLEPRRRPPPNDVSAAHCSPVSPATRWTHRAQSARRMAARGMAHRGGDRQAAARAIGSNIIAQTIARLKRCRGPGKRKPLAFAVGTNSSFFPSESRSARGTSGPPMK